MIDKRFMSGLAYNNDIYWITETGGHMMKFDVRSNRITYIQPEGLQDDGNAFIHSSFVCSDNKILYAIVNHGKQLLTYDTESNSYSCVNLDIGELNLYPVSSAVKCDDVLVVVLATAPVIVRICLEDYSHDVINFADRGIDQFVRNDVPSKSKDKLLLFTRNQFMILEYDIKTGIIKQLSKNPNVLGAIYVTCYNEKIYVLKKNGDVFCIENDIGIEIYKNKINVEEEYAYGQICIVKDIAWIMPGQAEEIIYLNLNTHEAEIYKDYPKDFTYSSCKEMGKYLYRQEVGHAYYFDMHSGNYIFSVNKMTGVGNFIDVIWPSEEDDIKEIKYKSNGQNFKESEISLNTYLQYITKEAEHEL